MPDSSCAFFKTPYARLLFHIASFAYLELLFRIWIYRSLFSIGTLYSVLYAIPAGILIFVLSSFFPLKINRFLSWALILIYTLIYATQVVYHSVFHTFLSLYSLTGTGQVLQFWQQILTAILKSLPIIIPMFVPLAVMLLFGLKKFRFYPLIRRYLCISIALFIVMHFFPLLFMNITGNQIYSPYDLYFRTSAPELSMQKLGMLTTMRLDFKRLIFGFNPPKNNPAPKPLPQPSEEDSTPSSGEQSEGQPTHPADLHVYRPNVMDIDFNSLIAKEKDKTIKNMHGYFASVQPTVKNKYTGLFKDCNLIFITAESYSHYVVDKDLTPTLYMLANQGFKFDDFYNPVWGVSTIDGEYVACTGLLPKSGVWSLFRSYKNHLPFAMGNQFSRLGYSSRAYHNHTYSYYERDKSHPNMGYDYKGVGNGLNITKQWPESDLEMVDVTTPEFINDKKFHVYYITVSGHLNYSFYGNQMANKNRKFVDALPYSEPVKAYLACNIELDRALKLLIERLEQAGVADKTVIAMSADHYPYGLTKENLDELAGHPVENNFELYKSSLILWKKGMTPITIDRVCSSLDIIPTLSNLFGLEYDSRLLMGQDIMSDSPPLVIFGNRSWITDKACYNAPADSLERITDDPLPENYAHEINKIVNDKFTYSALVLDRDYYRLVVPPN
ncbi:MAG: sulfatase-like hydrolase/transferase [Oscillospiraceae bacterium]|nr:sulfatase-like hydrolase/transferase [Oscillospiraceae bacterium]MDD4414405.1 sulfatase-like hydrolase/transferase [Oscillospiraceae bacterium]